jgi:hypothetical protein
MPRHQSDSETNLIFWEATIAKPSATRVTADGRLLALNDRATIAMRALCKRFKIDPKGHAFWNPPTSDQAGDALLDWMADLIASIHEAGLKQATIDAVFPVPAGIDHDACLRFFAASELPHHDDLIHILFALGIGPGAITGAALLLHRAQNPTGRLRVQDGEKKTGTSGTRRKLKV